MLERLHPSQLSAHESGLAGEMDFGPRLVLDICQAGLLDSKGFLPGAKCLAFVIPSPWISRMWSHEARYGYLGSAFSTGLGAVMGTSPAGSSASTLHATVCHGDTGNSSSEDELSVFFSDEGHHPQRDRCWSPGRRSDRAEPLAPSSNSRSVSGSARNVVLPKNFTRCYGSNLF